jgi:hypothetical protein
MLIITNTYYLKTIQPIGYIGELTGFGYGGSENMFVKNYGGWLNMPLYGDDLLDIKWEFVEADSIPNKWNLRMIGNYVYYGEDKQRLGMFYHPSREFLVHQSNVTKELDNELTSYIVRVGERVWHKSFTINEPLCPTVQKEHQASHFLENVEE